MALDHPGSGSINDLGGGVDGSGDDHRFFAGRSQSDRQPTDLAINGDASSSCKRGPDKLLTRAGNFVIDADGPIGHARRLPGDERPESSRSSIDQTVPWRSTPDGGIAQSGDVCNMAMVRPRSLGDLAKVGDNLYTPLAPPVAARAGGTASRAPDFSKRRTSRRPAKWWS